MFALAFLMLASPLSPATLPLAVEKSLSFEVDSDFAACPACPTPESRRPVPRPLSDQPFCLANGWCSGHDARPLLAGGAPVARTLLYALFLVNLLVVFGGKTSRFDSENSVFAGFVIDLIMTHYFVNVEFRAEEIASYLPLFCLISSILSKLFWMLRKIDSRARSLNSDRKKLSKLKLELLLKLVCLLGLEYFGKLMDELAWFNVIVVLPLAWHVGSCLAEGNTRKVCRPLVFSSFFAQMAGVLSGLATKNGAENVEFAMILLGVFLFAFACLQNFFGADFVLPFKLKPSFDYFQAKSNCDRTDCSICYEDLGKESMTTPCLHVFHSQCLLPWIELKDTCPECRARLPPERVASLNKFK